MENASKALLIAAAIIIAIILISLGVFVLNKGQDALGNIDLTPEQVSAFNSKWNKYKGKQMGSSVRSLIDQVNNYNRTANDDRYIYLSLGTEASTDNKEFKKENKIDNNKVKSTNVGAGASCNVTFAYTSGGLISEIHVKGNGTDTSSVDTVNNGK